jgi:hypothetical protein
MSQREDIISSEIVGLDSLTEYQRRKRAEAELATLEKVQELEAERSMRRWATASVVAETIADHPVAAISVGLAGLWIVGKILGNRRSG